MRISRIYQNVPLVLHDTVPLDEWAVSHTVTALRLKPGFIIHLFNGIDAGEYKAELVLLGKKQYGAKILAFIPRDTESPLHTHLGQSISKSDRMDFALQKAVELGVSEITPLISEYCAVKFTTEVLESRMRHWRNILISATEQSERCFVPQLHAAQPLREFVTDNCDETKLVFHPDTENTLRDLPNEARMVSFIIGPEGGISDSEIAHMRAHDFKLVKIGPRVVRTETATVIALSLLQEKWGDL